MAFAIDKYGQQICFACIEPRIIESEDPQLYLLTLRVLEVYNNYKCDRCNQVCNSPKAEAAIGRIKTLIKDQPI